MEVCVDRAGDVPGALTPRDSLGSRGYRAPASVRPNNRTTHLEGSRLGALRARPRRSAGRSGWPPAPSAPRAAAGTPGGSAAGSGPSGWPRSLWENRAVSTRRPAGTGWSGQLGPQHEGEKACRGSGAKGHDRCLRSASKKKKNSAGEMGSADEDHDGYKIKYANRSGNCSPQVKTKIQRCYHMLSQRPIFNNNSKTTGHIEKKEEEENWTYTQETHSWKKLSSSWSRCRI